MELVVLVDSAGSPVGVHPKHTVHGARTPRHLAFSCHILDRAGRVLMTRRSLDKISWPGVWTNAVCGHPQPEESMENAVRRRVAFELGATVDDIVCALPDFGYVARDASGIQENEHCPVFIARVASDITPNPDEVAELHWVEVDALRTAVDAAPWAFSPWLAEHLPLLMPHLSRASAEADAHV